MNMFLQTISSNFLKAVIYLLLMTGLFIAATEVEAARGDSDVGWMPRFAYSFVKRPGPAREVTLGAKQLKQQGYVKIGTIDLEHVHKDCFKRECKKKKCKNFKYKLSSADWLRKEAGKAGADVAVFDRKNFGDFKSFFGQGGWCSSWSGGTTTVTKNVTTTRTTTTPLTCNARHWGIVSQELKYSTADIWRKDPALRKRVDRDRAFHNAIRRGDVNRVKKFLATGMSLNEQDLYGVFPLNVAITHRHHQLVRYFLDQGARTDVYTKEVNYKIGNVWKIRYVNRDLVKVRPLHVAAATGTPETVKLLLASGASTADKTTRGILPLNFAAANRDHRVLSLILLKTEKGKINKKAWGGDTPLITAVAYGWPQNVRLLIDAGANVNAKRGRAVFLHRMLGGSRWLLNSMDIAHVKKSAAVDKKDRAAVQRYDRIIKMLSDAGVKRTPPPRKQSSFEQKQKMKARRAKAGPRKGC